MVDSTLAFNILARDLGASSTFDKLAREADKTADSLSKTVKVSDQAAKASERLTAANHKEEDALGKVRVAEQRLQEIRGNSNSTTSQILRAEEALAKARRDSVRASNDSSKAAKNLGNVLEEEGKKGGKGLGSSILHWFTGAGKDFEKAGQQAGESVNAGFIGTLKTPVVGPALIGGIVAAAAAAAVPVGAVVADGIIVGAGAGLAGIGLKFAAESEDVKRTWTATMADLGNQTKALSAPFERTLLALTVTAKRVFAKFAPELESAFQDLAPVVTGFGAQLGTAFAKLAPAIRPLSDAFSAVLSALGPAFQSMIGSVAAGLEKLAASVQKNPTALADFIRGVGAITGDLLSFLTTLNNANDSFTRFTGGVSAVDVAMGIVRGALQLVIGPITLVLKGFGFIGDALNALAGKMGVGSQVVQQTADALKKAGEGANSLAGATKAAAPPVESLTQKIQRQTAATDALIASMHRLSGLALSVRQAQVNYAQAVADASNAIKTNGRTLDLSTQKGRDNQRALNGVAQAAKDLTDAQVHQSGATQTAAQTAQQARAKFQQMAEKMGYSKAQAKALAQQLIDIPNVSRTVTITQKTQQIVSRQYAPVTSGQLDYFGHKLPGKAVGGPVTAGHSYLVGEKGPELFTPTRSGTILTNKQTMAAQKAAQSRAAANYNQRQKLDLFVNSSFSKGLMGSVNHVSQVFSQLIGKVLNLNLPNAKESRIVKYLQAESKLFVAAAKRRLAIAAQLKAAQDKLAAVVAARNEFRNNIVSSALQYNALTGVQAPDGGQLTSSGIIASITETLRKTQKFAADLAQLRKRGLNATMYRQIAEAGVDQGSSIAEALLSGNANTFNTLNRLQSNINSAAGNVGNTAADYLYGGAIKAAQTNVYHIQVSGALDAKATARQIVALLKELKRDRGGVSLGIA